MSDVVPLLIAFVLAGMAGAFFLFALVEFVALRFMERRFASLLAGGGVIVGVLAIGVQGEVDSGSQAVSGPSTDGRHRRGEWPKLT